MNADDLRELLGNDCSKHVKSCCVLVIEADFGVTEQHKHCQALIASVA